jgi:hypothetical protein
VKPVKLDDLVTQRLVKAVRAGSTWAGAARSAGIGPTTLFEWRAHGKRGEEPYATLVAKLDAALAQWVEDNLVAIQVAGERSWQALAWLLERRLPKEWGPRRDVAPPKPLTLAEAEEIVLAAAEIHKARAGTGK